MKCPHCNYIHGYHWDDNDEHVDIKGSDGPFYKMSNDVKMKVGNNHWETDENHIYG